MSEHDQDGERAVNARAGLTRRQFLGGLGAGALLTLGWRAGQPGAVRADEPGGAALMADVRVEADAIGKTTALIGYNQGHYMPGSNTSAWVEYSGVNVFRVWASPEYYAPDSAIDSGANVTDIPSFEAAKALLRQDPEHSGYIQWDQLEELFENLVYPGSNHYTLNYSMAELARLGVTVIAQLNSTAWGGSWADNWQQWEKYYAVAYYLAKHYNVQLFQFLNEPDHPSTAKTIKTQAIYIQGLQIASDALRAALADVNRDYGKALRARVLAPVLTHASSSNGNDHMDADQDSDHRDDQYGWGQISLMNLRTDYAGRQTDYDIFDIFDTHKYDKTAPDYASEITMMLAKMRQYTPTGVDLPITYSEFNRHTTGNFAKLPEDLNTPFVYRDIAAIYGATMQGGVLGMVAFKFSNTVSASLGPYKTGFHYAENSGNYDIDGVTRGAEVVRLFAKGFKGGRDLLAIEADSSDGAYTMYAAHDPAARSYYLWSAQPSDTADYAVRLDLHKLRLHPGATRGVIIEEVSANHFGDVALLAPLPDSRKLALVQPKQSVWLITVPDDSVANEASVTASADALVQGGAAAGQNFGGAATLGVRLDTSGQLPGQASYLAFTLPDVPDGALNRVILQVYGRNATDAGSLSFAVYASVSASWDEGQIAWNNAPGLDVSAAKLTGVGGAFFPAGHLTVSGTPGYAWADVTDFVRRHPGRALTFVLIRQARFADDNADDGRTAELASRESADPAQRPQLLVWW